jgi:hypothetical protein
MWHAWGEEECIQRFGGKDRRKEPLGRLRRRWKNLREIGWGGMDWINLAQDRELWRALVNTVMDLRFP